MRFQDEIKPVIDGLYNNTIGQNAAEETIMNAFKNSHQKAVLIVTKARRLRDLQKEYFKSKRPSVLEQCKKLEAEFDELIKPEPPDTQKQLFN